MSFFFFLTRQGFHLNRQKEGTRPRGRCALFSFLTPHHKEYAMTGPLTPTEIILIVVLLFCLLVGGAILLWPRGGDEYTRDTTTSYNSRGHQPTDY